MATEMATELLKVLAERLGRNFLDVGQHVAVGIAVRITET